MDKENVVYILTFTMEYYSAIKKNEILPHVTTWMDPEGIMLKEISQRKTNTVGSLFMWNLKENKQINKTIGRCRRWAVGGQAGKTCEGGQKEQTSSCEIHKSRGSNVQHGYYSQ